MSTRRRVADAPLAILVAVAAILGAALGAFVLKGRPSAADAFAACETLATRLLQHAAVFGRLTPLLVVCVAVVAGGLALIHQLVATRRMIRRVLGHQIVSSPRIADVARAAGLGDRLTVIDDAHAFAFCHGYGAPQVCISSGLVAVLDDAELLAVLRHEAHHVRYRDPLKILVCRSLASALFFLPLAGALRNGYLAGKELCADDDAARGDGLPLARALLKLLGASRPAWPAGVLAIGALTPTEIRLEHLLAEGAPRPMLPAATDWLATAVLVAGLFGFSYGTAAAASTPTAPSSCGPVVATVAAPDAWLAPAPGF